MLQIQGVNLNLVATDLEIQISTSAKLDKAAADHAVTVSARKLQDILRALPENTAVTLDAQEGRLQVRGRQEQIQSSDLASPGFSQGWPRVVPPRRA
jgi:DNA polymerase-3 subunit beta